MSSLDTERETREDRQERYNMSRRNDSEPDREISLNTSTILLIFFALALVCSAFFGFGYTMGRKTTPPTTIAAAEDHTDSLREAFKSFKPAPGSGGTKPGTTSGPENATPSDSVVVSTTAPKTAVPPPVKKPFDPDAEIVTEAPAPKPTAIAKATPSILAPVAVSTGTVIVQVAAVSHQEDADTMLAALKRKGYSVSIHQESQDRLLHLQLGPYASKKDAEAMRTRLLADGYNSILK